MTRTVIVAFVLAVSTGVLLSGTYVASAQEGDAEKPVADLPVSSRSFPAKITLDGKAAQRISSGDQVVVEGLDESGPCSFRTPVDVSRVDELKSSQLTTQILPANCPVVKLSYVEIVKQHSVGPDGAWDGTLRDEKLNIERYLVLDGDTYKPEAGSPHGQDFTPPGVVFAYPLESQRGSRNGIADNSSILGGLLGSAGLLLVGGMVWRWSASRRREV